MIVSTRPIRAATIGFIISAHLMIKTASSKRFRKNAINSFLESIRDFLMNSILRNVFITKSTTPAAKQRSAVGAEGQSNSANAARDTNLKFFLNSMKEL